MKYIVYKTTNLINNFIYIGVHSTDNPNSFDGYLGCGVRINKPTTYEKAKTCFQQAVKQFGLKNFKREVIATFDTAEEAYELEELIVNEEFLARSDVYNMILGGQINHAKGCKVYQYNSTTGKLEASYDSCTLAAEAMNCSQQTITRAISHFYMVKNTIFSYIKEDIIDTTPYINKLKPISVYRYKLTGEFDQEFSSLSEAGKNSLHTTPAYILKATTLGYLVKDTYYFSFYKEASFDIAKSKQILNRKVYQYDSDGKFIKEYLTQAQAEKENPYCNITNAIKFKTSDINNNMWSLEKLLYFNVPSKIKNKKVAKYDDNGNILQVWESITKCQKEVGVAVSNVLKGKYTKHKGYIYKYIE